MKKVITLLAVFILSAQFSFAQQAIAKIKFEEAEEAYAAKNYETTVKKLDEVDAILKNPTPKVMYLRIMAQSFIIKKNPLNDYKIIENTRTLCTTYLKDYESIPDNEDKYRDIYKTSETLNTNYPATLDEFNNKVEQRKQEIATAEKRKQEIAMQEQRRQQQIEIENEQRRQRQIAIEKEQQIARQIEAVEEAKARESYFGLEVGYEKSGKYYADMNFLNNRGLGFYFQVRYNFDRLNVLSGVDMNSSQRNLYDKSLSDIKVDERVSMFMGSSVKLFRPLWLTFGVGYGDGTPYKEFKYNGKVLYGNDNSLTISETKLYYLQMGLDLKLNKNFVLKYQVIYNEQTTNTFMNQFGIGVGYTD